MNLSAAVVLQGALAASAWSQTEESYAPAPQAAADEQPAGGSDAATQRGLDGAANGRPERDPFATSPLMQRVVGQDAKLKALEQQSEKLRSQLADHQAQSALTQTALEQLRAQIAAEQLQSKQTQGALDKLRTQITDQQSQSAQTQAAIGAQEKRLELLSGQLQEQSKLLENVQSLLAEQKTAQRSSNEDLAAELAELKSRLSAAPPMRLLAVAVRDDGTAVAHLEIDGAQYVLHQGETIDLRPARAGEVVQSIRLREIRGSSAVVEVGPWDRPVVLR